MTETTKRPTLAAVTAVAAVLVFAGAGVGAGTAYADDNPSVPPGTEPSATAPVPIDSNSPGLKLPQGATLAPPKVLDIAQVVEDLGGEERRQDTNESVMFALQAEVLFGKDSAVLNAQANARIRAIADEINRQHATKVRVFGFTDNLGSYEHGKTLSKQRADAVQRELAKTVDPGITFDIRGYSEDYPIADNATEEGRRKNRRVEITFPRGESGQ
ncbi:OmpA family protein [Streptomyces sp. NRRL S-87]|uniref:OmpA family protein n=1 Tax=Streptomyces sp. NRRL S-87 TaxID=1463920 RepID=UPI0004C09349|nr:OmpA family protein [Streptomyces sp. NRRL S-87]